MSTGLECQLVEIRDKQWYYLLEDGWAPKHAWDWREYATAYGPFTSEDAALKHLHLHHANPGGYSTSSLVGKEIDEVLAHLIKKAQR